MNKKQIEKWLDNQISLTERLTKSIGREKIYNLSAEISKANKDIHLSDIRPLAVILDLPIIYRDNGEYDEYSFMYKDYSFFSLHSGTCS